jgi:hypothetical protein
MKIKSITIEHHDLGKITVFNGLSKEENEKIGTIAPLYSKYTHYFAGVIKKDNIFILSDLRVITPEDVSVGWKKTSYGGIGFVPLYFNKYLSQELEVHSKGVYIVEYDTIPI